MGRARGGGDEVRLGPGELEVVAGQPGEIYVIINNQLSIIL